MSRSRSRLELAAERALKACAPVLLEVASDDIQRMKHVRPQTEEARGALMELAAALESNP